jgi:hypothetical protein
MVIYKGTVYARFASPSLVLPDQPAQSQPVSSGPITTPSPNQHNQEVPSMMKLPLSETSDEGIVSVGLARLAAPPPSWKMRKFARCYLNICFLVSFSVLFCWAVFQLMSYAPTVSFPCLEPPPLQRESWPSHTVGVSAKPAAGPEPPRCKELTPYLATAIDAPNPHYASPYSPRFHFFDNSTSVCASHYSARFDIHRTHDLDG